MVEHYYSKKQTSKLKIRRIKTTLRGNKLEFYSGSGVFSIRKIDKGTRLLIEKCIIKPKWRILDLGCGYGVVGIAIAKAFPSTRVFMSDINERALELAKMNIELNNVRAEVIQSDIYEQIHGRFNTILVNPPQVAGKEVCFSMIEEGRDYLFKNGLFQLVARHNKGGKELSKKMYESFGNIEAIAKSGGYRVYLSRFI